MIFYTRINERKLISGSILEIVKFFENFSTLEMNLLKIS